MGSRVVLTHRRRFGRRSNGSGPGGRAAAVTLGDLIDEYLEVHQAEPVTMARLRWLLRKATTALGEVRLAETRGVGHEAQRLADQVHDG